MICWNDLLAQPITSEYDFFHMAYRRGSGWQSYSIAVLVVVIVSATGIALLHWHKELASQDCQLCHVRDLPTLHTNSASDFGVVIVTESRVAGDNPRGRSQVLSFTRASRAPPEAAFLAA